MTLIAEKLFKKKTNKHKKAKINQRSNERVEYVGYALGSIRKFTVRNSTDRVAVGKRLKHSLYKKKTTNEALFHKLT